MLNSEIKYVTECLRNNKTYGDKVTDVQIDYICQRVGLNIKESFSCSVALVAVTADLYAKQSVEMNKLKAENTAIKAQLELLKNNKVVSDKELRLCKMKNGGQTAYKHEASKELISYYKQRGMSNEDIAKELGVGLTTVWRRLNDYKRSQEKRLGI